MGKPILHFLKIEDDPCVKYLQNYPLALIIDERENNPEKHARQIEAFAREQKGNCLTFGEVARCIPEYIGKNVVEHFVQIAEQTVSEAANHAKE